MIVHGRAWWRAVFLAAVAVLASARGGAAMDDGSPTAAPGAEAARESAEPVTDYTLRARLDADAHVIHGQGTILLRNRSPKDLTELWLHLYLNGFKNQSSVFLRDPIGGFRGTAPVTEWGYIDVKRLAWKRPGGDVDLMRAVDTHAADPTDETDARVALPVPLAAGAEMTLDVAWEARLPEVVERTGHAGSFHFAGQWFPKLARLDPSGTFAHFTFHHLAEFHADFGSYDVTIDVPKAFVVGATGPRISEQIQGDRRVVRHAQSSVHDFAWTAWDRFESREDTVDGVKITYLSPPGYDAAVRREVEAMRFAIPHYRAHYGRYPYGVLTVVYPPESAREAGGMEYPTLITTGGRWWGPPGVLDVELVTLHEFGHQYFYGLLASNEAEHPFLDEGVNSWAEARALEAWRGEASLVRLLGLEVSDHAVQIVGRAHVHDARVGQPARAFSLGSQYGGLVYGRTATLLETARRVYGTAAMDAAMLRYATEQRFRHPGPEDLLSAIAASVSPEAAAMLRVGLFDRGWVDFAVADMGSHALRPAAGVFDREGKRETVDPPKDLPGGFGGWVLVTRRGTMSFPVDVELWADDGTSKRVAWDGKGESTRIPYEGAARLAGVVVDPDHKILADQDYTNNFTGTRRGRLPRVLDRLTHGAEQVLVGVAP
jgi:hypothetical protein